MTSRQFDSTLHDARINVSDYKAWTRRADAATIDSIEATNLPTLDMSAAVAPAGALAPELARTPPTS